MERGLLFVSDLGLSDQWRIDMGGMDISIKCPFNCLKTAKLGTEISKSGSKNGGNLDHFLQVLVNPRLETELR